ncbi:sulfite exporter TauE/SafE family protein [Salinicoccus hispanicus]|uniref:Probable membrane transporter protein n=2 Tax=Salinicoccus hispanicus TaxID=157225 RepID=A0A6N8U1U5_9STAP|nr:TSUP family transporter [Salinicoccus hispanicus]
MILWAIPLGIVIGIMSGFFGIGGGFILTPVLMLMGFSPVVAITISLLYTISTSLSGAWVHFQFKNIYWKAVLFLSIGGIAGTQIARPIVLWLQNRGIDELAIPIIYLVLLAYFSISMFASKNKNQDDLNNNTSRWIFLMLGIIGGVASSTLGVGGGFIMVPLLITLAKIPPKLAVGTSLVSITFIVAIGFISYAASTPIDYILAFYLILGALIGTQIGPRLTKVYSNDQIQHLLGGLYVVTFISVLFKLLNLSLAGLVVLLLYIAIVLGLFIFRVFRQKENKVVNAG